MKTNHTNVVIELNYDCNFHCVHCYHFKPERGNYITLNDVRHIEAKIRPLDVIRFFLTGGEPLLNPSFRDIYVYLHSMGYQISVTTNGSLLDNSIIELFREFPPFILTVSVYGYDSATYRKTTRTNNFETLVENIRQLTENGIIFRLSYIALTTNCSFEDVMTFLKSLNAPYGISSQLIPHRNGDNSNLVYQLKEEAIDQIMTLSQDPSIVRNIPDSIDGSGECRIWTQSFVVSPRGKVRPCIPYFGEMADIFDDDLTELLEKLERLHRAAYVYPSECLSCGIRQECLCPLLLSKYDRIDLVPVCETTSKWVSYIQQSKKS